MSLPLQFPAEEETISYSLTFDERAKSMTLRDIVKSTGSFTDDGIAPDNKLRLEATCSSCGKHLTNDGNYIGICTDHPHQVSISFDDKLLSMSLKELLTEFVTLTEYEKVVLYYVIALAIVSSNTEDPNPLDVVQAIALSEILELTA